MSCVKGSKKTGGRSKGTPNKLTVALKDMILGALDDAGGQRYLVKQAKENPGPFLTLLGKVLPTTIAGDPDNPLIPVDELSDKILSHIAGGGRK